MTLSALFVAGALGLALAADAFAASLCQGTSVSGARHSEARALAALRIGAAFGGAQALAPFLGVAAGAAFAGAMAAYDHWIAFAILSALGVKLLKDGLTEGPEDKPARALARGWALAALAVATSIDAAAAGATFAPLQLPPLSTAFVIGAITFVTCAAGVHLGARLGASLGGRAEVFGGVALIGLGVKTLFDHGALTL